jgi:hypothetical protein
VPTERTVRDVRRAAWCQALAGVLAAAVVTTVAAQAPVVNALVRHRTASGSTARDVQTIAQEGIAAWVGYRVPIVASRGTQLRDTGNCCGRCRLEPSTELIVLARVADRALVELRPEAVDCDIDASGMPLIWLDGVRPEDSIAWLASLMGSSTAVAASPSTPLGTTRQMTSRMDDRALTAIALHASAAAGPALVTVARTGATAALRGRALFWLAQRAATEALPAINRALDDDPDTQVKKQAVFALSQLPKDQGIPRLIELARGHANSEVRRQAMLRLGQSKDQRAVDFFASILK